jgi:CheY-like chemotaxis protein
VATTKPGASGATPKAAATRGPVLVVDPDPDVRQSTILLMEALGYEAVGLGEAPDIFDSVLRERPSLVFLETQMPGLNIAGMMAALRSDLETASVPVVFFSAILDLPAQAQRHQAAGHLAKPFGFQELARILDRFVGPPPGRATFEASQDVEKEVRLAFREYRNMLAAFNNYTTLLDKSKDLPPHDRAHVERLQDLVLMLEARTVRLRAYILALIGPAEQVTLAPKEAKGILRSFRRPNRTAGKPVTTERASRPVRT